MCKFRKSKRLENGCLLGLKFGGKNYKRARLLTLYYYLTSCIFFLFYEGILDWPGGPGDNNPPANAGDQGSFPGPGRFHMQWRNEARGP